jgi:hypothetical protein
VLKATIAGGGRAPIASCLRSLTHVALLSPVATARWHDERQRDVGVATILRLITNPDKKTRPVFYLLFLHYAQLANYYQ